MNLQDYQEKLIEDPNWGKNNVVQFPVCDILDDDHMKNNEVRAVGLNAEEYERTKASIREVGRAKAPIGITIQPGKGQKGQKARGNDCHHRVKAYRELYEETKDPKWLKIPAIVESFAKPADRKLSMLNSNLPDRGAIATSDDIVLVYHALITENFVLESDYSKLTKEQISDYIKKTLKRPLTHQALAGIAKRIFNKLAHVSAKYWRPVNDKEIVEKFNDINPFGMTLPSGPQHFDKDNKYDWGIIVKDGEGQRWAVYSGKQPTWFRQNIVHYALNKKSDDSRLKVMVIGWNSNLVVSKKHACPVANFRKNTYASTSVLRPDINPVLNVPLVDSVVYLPQITKGEKEEDMRRLYDHEGKIIE